MSSTIDFWTGEFGDRYTERNAVDWQARIPFLRRILEQTQATSFLDVGCNAGWNLRALKAIDPDRFVMSGIDINHAALKQAAEAGFDVINCPATQCCDDPLSPECAELVITSGVLIHVPPEDLRATLTAIRDASSAFILAIEYRSLSGEEEPVEYRGHEGKLWRRDFGREFLAVGGLSLVEFGEADGYTDCAYWLLSKE